MSQSVLKIASVCMNSKAEITDNVEKALRLTKFAAEKGAHWVLLPEMFTYMGPYSGLFESAEFENGPLNLRLAKFAKEHGITLFAGTVGEKPGSQDDNQIRSPQGFNRVFNTLYGFSDKGRPFVKYRKTHLFELAAFEKGDSYSEAEGFLPGNELIHCEYQGWNIGFAICYDLRFPELFSRISKEKPLDMLIIPSAFTEATGKRHWKLLLQARAVENQCYVLAANQTGEHSKGKKTYGHSMIIDPWGKVLANTEEKEGFVVAEVSKGILTKFRRTLPVRENRRVDLYP